MHADDFFKLVGAMRAPFRLALREGLLGAIIGRWKMIDASEKSAEEFAVRADAADCHAAEARAMKAALAPDQPLAGAFTTEVVISDGDF